MNMQQALRGTLRAGDTAPDFELIDTGGHTIRLADYRDKSAVVVYFYPKDETAGCTMEACAFRDSYESFKQAGAEVIGISEDTVESHIRFASRHRLPFVLLADPGGKTASAWGVPRPLGFLRGRTTYVIDRQGVIRHVFTDLLNSTKHVSTALDVLKQIT
jgi:peroxiredoxin Q/BCP